MPQTKLTVRLAACPWIIVLVLLCLCPAHTRAQTFSNTTNIRIPASGTGPGSASPYPSSIVVSGLTGPVADLTIDLFGITHTFPADIGILLVGPTGQSVVLMSNTGSNCGLTGINLRFADGSPPLPAACIAPGTYSPTALGAPLFAAPAPVQPYGNALSLFSGTSGNGTWSLFVIDDAFLDSGAIAGGWSITFSQTMVTFQGKLERAIGTINGNADFVFALFSLSSGGTAMATVPLNNVPVTNNVFTVELPLNSALFDSTPRWLEIAVRSPAGSGFFNVLSPRQSLDSSPLALHARTAGLATSAISSQNATHADSATSASLSNHADTADTADFATSAGAANTAALSTAAQRLDSPDGSPTAAVFVANDGSVGIGTLTPTSLLSVGGTTDISGNLGIGTTAPARRLHVANGSAGGVSQAAAELLVEDDASCYINLMAPDTNEHGVTFGSPTSSVHGGIYYLNSVGMDFRTGSNASRLTINSTGNVGIGVGVSGGSIDAKLHVSAAGARAAKFDRTGSDGELVAFSRDDGVVGNITVSGSVVSYNAFTGSHWAWIDEAPSRGTLVSMTGDNRSAAKDGGEVIYGVRVTPGPNDPACLGAYLATTESPQDCHQIMAVGNGEMWVVNTGRDIEPGDYLITSDVPGCAMLDDPTRFHISNVIAKAAERVHWKDMPALTTGPQQHRLSVLFTSFAISRTAAADQALQTQVDSLKTQNADLKARLERMEKLLARTAK